MHFYAVYESRPGLRSRQTESKITCCKHPTFNVLHICYEDGYDVYNLRIARCFKILKVVLNLLIHVNSSNKMTQAG